MNDSSDIAAARAPASPWPSSGPDFNRWWKDAAAFVALVQQHPSVWLDFSRAKYIELRIDTRSGCFRLKDRGGVEFTPDEWIARLAENANRARAAEPTP